MQAQGFRGYTLIELLITLSIAAILGSLSISGLSHLAARTVQYNAIQSTITSLNRTRYLAVKLNRRIGLCSLTEDAKCSTDWSGKYLGGFIDANQNRKIDSGEEIVFRQEWNPSLNIQWDDRFTNSAITYQPNGTVVSNGTIYLSNNGKPFAKLIVNNYGRFRIVNL